MDKRRPQKSGTSRRPYERPVLRTIELAAEETLTVGCKLSDGGTASGGFTCISNSCVAPGS